MILVINNGNGSFTIHYHPEKLGKSEEELGKMGLLIDTIPEPEIIEGKEAVLRFDGNKLYYDYVDIQPSNEEKIQQLRSELENTIIELTTLIALQGGNA